MAPAVAAAASHRSSYEGRLWRTDLKAIVGAVLFGIVTMLLNQVTDRVDTALTGGAFTILGAVSFFTMNVITTYFFRLPGGIIGGWVQAIIAVASGSTPLAPAFIIADTIIPIVFALFAWRLPMRSWGSWIIALLVTVLIGDLPIAWGLSTLLHLPGDVVLVAYIVASVAGFVGSLILAKPICNALERSGVLD